MINYEKKFRLDNKKVIVCGGLGLIGKEVSIALSQSGAEVLILDIDEKLGETFVNENKKLNFGFEKFDMTDLKNLQNNIKKLFSQKIDVWVNLGYPRTSDWGNKLEDVKIDSWQKNVDMHMNSYCLITKCVAEEMINKKIEGNIINFGSIYGVVGPYFEVYEGLDMTMPAAYSAIKGGIINFSKYAASYYGNKNIRINTICPGGIFDNQNPKFVEKYNKRTCLKRMGKPEEIASTTLFLASPAASYITGATIIVDGGWTSI